MKSSITQRLYAILITSTIIGTPLVGIFGPFDNGNPEGQTTMELFLPAGYAFSIWGVIYLGLVALAIWQGLPNQRHNPRARQAAPWLAVTAIGNGAWILAAGSVDTAPLTIPALLVMQISGWVTYLKLDVGNKNLPRIERRLHIPLQIYVGWMSVATIANSAAVLNILEWSGWGISPVAWTIIMLFTGTAVCWFVGQLAGDDNIYRAVFVWAFIAIFVAQQAFPVVAWSSLAAALLVLLMIITTRPAQHQQRFKIT